MKERCSGRNEGHTYTGTGPSQEEEFLRDPREDNNSCTVLLHVLSTTILSKYM